MTGELPVGRSINKALAWVAFLVLIVFAIAYTYQDKTVINYPDGYFPHPATITVEDYCRSFLADNAFSTWEELSKDERKRMFYCRMKLGY